MPPKSSQAVAGSSSSRPDRSIRMLHDLLSRAWSNFTILSKASPELEPLCSQILSIIGALHIIDDHREKGEISDENKKTLQDIGFWLNGLFSDLEAELADLKEGHSQEGFTPMAEKQLDPHSQLTAFIQLLRRDRQYKIWNALEEIHGNDPPESHTSVASDWTFLELQMHGLSKDILQEEFFFINDWFKGRKEDNHRQVTELRITDIAEEEDTLPDYTPGNSRDPIKEKIRDLDLATQNISLDAKSGEAALFVKADPPPYTFEEGAEQPVDDAEWSHYIQKATDMEMNIRIAQKENNAESASSPLSWLPPAQRKVFLGSKEVVDMMEKDSFTVMAYETAPRCTEIVDRIMLLFNVTFDRKLADSSWEVVNNGIRSLKVIASALLKFTLLENQQQANAERFSDLDLLHFEYSTALTMHPDIQFPHREFDLVQKSYYRLLTYIMGYLEAMAVIFPGRTYISRSKEDLDSAWKEIMMDSRIAWVEKQLATWDTVVKALLLCREWHRLHSGMRFQALEVLKLWAKSENILSGAENDQIELTVIAAAALSRSSFRIPTPFAKVTYYGPNRFGGAMLVSEHKTDVSPKTQNPIWNKPFSLTIQPNSKFINIEVCDKFAGMDKQLATAKLAFSFIPGIEANLLDRSLVYGYDEEVELPMTDFDGKGRERDPPILRLRLKWPGRVAALDELGLPYQPPGKMFRAEVAGIPYTPEERENVRMGRPPRRNSSARGGSVS